MKTIRLPFLAILATALVFFSCQKSLQNEVASVGAFENLQSNQQNVWGNPSAYIVTLESRTQQGSDWVWTWSVRNSNPGNGQNGTFQNLSHWGMQFGTCVDMSNISAAAYSADGVEWTYFTPTCQVDPSQTCMIDPVLKFDLGTTGANKSYYRLVTSYDYAEGTAKGFYKSGNTTGCAVIEFQGISCGLVPDR